MIGGAVGGLVTFLLYRVVLPLLFKAWAIPAPVGMVAEPFSRSTNVTVFVAVAGGALGGVLMSEASRIAGTLRGGARRAVLLLIAGIVGGLVLALIQRLIGSNTTTDVSLEFFVFGALAVMAFVHVVDMTKPRGYVDLFRGSVLSTLAGAVGFGLLAVSREVGVLPDIRRSEIGYDGWLLAMTLLCPLYVGPLVAIVYATARLRANKALIVTELWTGQQRLSEKRKDRVE
jgi:hypothetical protein